MQRKMDVMVAGVSHGAGAQESGHSKAQFHRGFQAAMIPEASPAQAVAHPHARLCPAPILHLQFPPQTQDVMWNDLKHHLLIITYYARCPVLI